MYPQWPKWMILAALLSAITFPARGQDSPSLGDVARQMRSQKSASQPKKVITNDDLPAPSTGAVLGLSGSGDPAGIAAPNSQSAALASLSRWELIVKKIDSIDRGALVKLALQGANPDFPGHEKWEDRLMAAKATYVSQGLELIESARQLLESAQALKTAEAKPDDPRVKDLADNLKTLVQQSVRCDAAFQAVILEGRDLAHQASPQ
jgi:hypothetical protein